MLPLTSPWMSAMHHVQRSFHFPSLQRYSHQISSGLNPLTFGLNGVSISSPFFGRKPSLNNPATSDTHWPTCRHPIPLYRRPAGRPKANLSSVDHGAWRPCFGLGYFGLCRQCVFIRSTRKCTRSLWKQEDCRTSSPAHISYK